MSSESASVRGLVNRQGDDFALQALLVQAGISIDLWEMGAASCAYSEGCHGITRADFERFVELLEQRHAAHSRALAYLRLSINDLIGQRMGAEALRECLQSRLRYAAEIMVRSVSAETTQERTRGG